MHHPVRPIPMGQLLLCGALIVTMSMGIRHSFGLWLQPITMAHGWTREDYSLAMAIQNLVWGAAGPVVGWWADRSGAFKVLWSGALLYALGLVGMATTTQHLGFVLTTGVLIGLGQACSTYTVIFGVVGRNVTLEQRSMAMGITAAAGSFGQFLMVPVASLLLHNTDWSSALLILAVTALAIGPLAFGLREKRFASGAVAVPGAGTAGTNMSPQTAGQALKEAFGHRDYLLLTAGYFVCGFQLAFIGVHLPSYLKDHQLAPQVATTALALIGLFNVLGSYAAGALGARVRKNWILSSIYGLRALAMLLFIMAPLSAWSVGIFAAAMGTLWLSTVPPTNAIVAQMHGVRHLSMLGGIVFFSHQIGSFLGVWLAGRLYDFTDSYQVVWWLAIALGVLAALVNLPIQEQRQPGGRLQAT
ncbi:MAG: MFS transporter [Aquabacterium sp.]|uniref:MFS transporter n=1 Tax=Aquabacterium sp. TaxID=1872578 RepID=UPI0025C20471|nr:MFS transporter [Aquabacterium sp.]MBI5924056.1 MFS transporter [Aquabacterium sp.]